MYSRTMWGHYIVQALIRPLSYATGSGGGGPIHLGRVIEVDSSTHCAVERGAMMEKVELYREWSYVFGLSVARSNLVIDQQSHDRSWNYVARVKRDLIPRSDSISPRLLHLRIANTRTWMKLNIDWRDEEEAVLVV